MDSSDSPLVRHLLNSWRPASRLSLFDPRVCKEEESPKKLKMRSPGEVEMEVNKNKANKPNLEQKPYTCENSKTRFTAGRELVQHLKTYRSAAVIAESHCLEPTAMKTD